MNNLSWKNNQNQNVTLETASVTESVNDFDESPEENQNEIENDNF